jgi:leucyl aminopeptidase
MNVVGLIPTTENMPGGASHQDRGHRHLDVGPDHRDPQHRRRGPPDPVRRPHLRRALRHPTAVIDVATLTGACVIALGSGGLGPDGQQRRSRRAELLTSGQDAGDKRLAATAVGGLPGDAQEQFCRHPQHQRQAARREPSPAACFLARFAKNYQAGRTSTSPAPPGVPAPPRAATGRPVPLLTHVS